MRGLDLAPLKPPVTVSVVIPVFNEVRWVEEIIRRVRSADRVGCDLDVVVVDDCSTDGTSDKLKALAASVPEIRLFRQERNQGKGAALRRGFKEAKGQIVITQDADLEYSPADYPVLIRPLLEGSADVVFGSRFLGGPHRVHRYWHAAANRILTLASNAFSNLDLTDMETGYKVLRREVLDLITLEQDRFGFEPEITAKVARVGARVYEVPISYSGRSYEEGKKIGWKDALKALWCIVRYNLRG